MSNKSAEAVSVQETVDHSIELGHGNSPAAWSSVTVMLLGSIIACIAFIIGESATMLFWIGGAGVIAVGIILGPILSAAGYGVGGSKLKNNGH